MKTKYAVPKYRLSPIIESLTDKEGNGIVGFTIQYSERRIENHICHFTPATRAEKRELSEKEYQKYTALLQSKPDNSDKLRRTP